MSSHTLFLMPYHLSIAFLIAYACHSTTLKYPLPLTPFQPPPLPPSSFSHSPPFHPFPSSFLHPPTSSTHPPHHPLPSPRPWRRTKSATKLPPSSRACYAKPWRARRLEKCGIRRWWRICRCHWRGFMLLLRRFNGK